MRNYYVLIVSVIGLFLALITVSPALEVIVDNSDTAPDKYCTKVGDWLTSTSGVYGVDKYVHTQKNPAASVTWVTTQLPPGWYLVYFRINSNNYYATDARYTIVHRDGTDNLVINQQRTSSGWFILGGAYYFDGASTVTLSGYHTGGEKVVADAIRFWSVFSFVQMSDSHIGYGQGNTDTANVVNELKTLGKCTMGTYGFDAPPPSFAIHSGDFTEYGQEYWSTMESIFAGLPFPVYFVQGNHDSTWSSCKERIRTKYGATPYSFDYYDRGTRYHFACLNSPVIQSPRAGFAREELDWLAADLAALESNTPVFINLHHPINGTSDPKPYDSYRLMQTIRPYRVLIIFYGHGHNNSTTTFDGTRIVQGGSTYSDSGEGNYNLVAVTHGRIYICKKVRGEATAATTLLNYAIPASATYPNITVSSPAAESIQTNSTVTVTASISGASGSVTAVDFELDGDGNWRSMTGSGNGPYTATLNLAGAVHGRHWIRVRFTMSSGGPWYKMVPFWYWDALPRARWIVDLGAASLCCPAVVDGKVYVGTNGGTFRCLNAATGAEIWRVNLPSDVVSSPAVADGRVIFGCGDSKVYCLNASNGAILWTKTCTGPVYSSPTIDGNAVYIGTIGNGASGSRYLYSLNTSTGAENWKFSAANAIETKPCVLGNTVFFGDWGSYFYAVYTSNGTQRWRYQRNSNRYYSPADSWPVASATANRVFVADREYYLNAININTGTADWTRTSVSSQGITPDWTALLVRLTSGNLEKTTFDNSTIWSRNCSLDSAPVSPMCNGNRAAIVDQDGLVSVVNLTTGTIEYQFQVACGYQLNPVNIDSAGNVYAATYDGYLVCATNLDYSGVDWENLK